MLIQIAQMVGSDYTEGLPGIGIVSAMEILAEFRGEDSLRRFATWWRAFQSGHRDIEDSPSPEFVRKYVRNSWGFPFLSFFLSWSPPIS